MAVYLAALVVPGIKIENFFRAVIVGAVIALVNYTVKPLMVLLTLPVTVLTLGLFLLVINALMVMLVAYLVKGFEVGGFWSALLFSLCLSLVNTILELASGK